MDGKVVKRQDTPMPEDSPSPNIKAEPSSPDLRALNQLQNIIELSREMEGFNLIPLPGDEFKLDTSVKKMCPTHGVEIKGESDVSIFEDPSASGPAYKKTRCK
ncbi:hypothetical protein GLAREA_05295 [Glarea lozoyensis ATCC 20868]|uniref:Uncharacterized protein n=1 Tax=Glarea lozoyensis (strain ATCC 20868 / MF5171) TaxID=1116229 RepID=S3DC02_GLAL2|nr:uncharacterized protein GLAREA_05295 [Glarea lozoyensis ATCC 20868]EPE35957.1 hypothetical protein GLAREA_05295 [Glarea lozoyensis ATCC 20868]